MMQAYQGNIDYIKMSDTFWQEKANIDFISDVRCEFAETNRLVK